MNTLKRLEVIFKDVFDDDSLVLNRETNADDIEDWDSLAQINLIAACEKEFGLRFEIDEIVVLANVGDMVDLIESKL